MSVFCTIHSLLGIAAAELLIIYPCTPDMFDMPLHLTLHYILLPYFTLFLKVDAHSFRLMCLLGIGLFWVQQVTTCVSQFLLGEASSVLASFLTLHSFVLAFFPTQFSSLSKCFLYVFLLLSWYHSRILWAPDCNGSSIYIGNVPCNVQLTAYLYCSILMPC